MTDNILSKRFGQLIKKLRLEQGLSQENFATMCGLHRTYIGSIERGEKNVTLATANKLAEALNTKLSTVISMIENEETSK